MCVVGLCLFLGCENLLGLCSGSEDALGPSRPVSTAGSRCVVCGLMFSPTSRAEGAPDLFISAGEAAVSNSSGYLFGRLYTALAALCSMTCGPMCARPHALWLRTARLRWAQTYYETGWGRMRLWWSFFLCIFYLKYFSMQGRALLSKTTLHCTDQGSVLHVHAFRTTHVCATFLCTAWVAFFFIVFPLTYPFFLVYGCALLLCSYAHCIRHSSVLQVYTFCTACMLLCAKVVTGYANAADCMAYS